jgi:hypothetical protein
MEMEMEKKEKELLLSCLELLDITLSQEVSARVADAITSQVINIIRPMVEDEA